MLSNDIMPFQMENVSAPVQGQSKGKTKVVPSVTTVVGKPATSEIVPVLPHRPESQSICNGVTAGGTKKEDNH